MVSRVHSCTRGIVKMACRTGSTSHFYSYNSSPWDISLLLSLFRFFLTHGLTRCHSFPLDSFVHFYEHLEAYCIWHMGMIIALIDDPGKTEI